MEQTSSQERNINKPHFITFFFPSKNNFTQLILCSNYTLRQILDNETPSYVIKEQRNDNPNGQPNM